MAAMPAKSSRIIDTEPTNTPDEFSYKHATFEDVLEDLSSRFILNLPEDELAEVERVCFQVEQAHWYYEDFIRDENPSFPTLPLKKFSEILFRSCPLLHHWSNDHETAFNGFMSYKTRVPVCGAIMLNEALTKCVLVKGWKSSAGWGFPKGKVNENEDEAFCAVREVLEETGYNLSGKIRRTDCIRFCVKQQPITLFVVAGVPEEFPFKTQTRKEISKIDWFKLADLPTWTKNRSTTNKFYLITPVIGPLKVIVRNLRKARRTARPHSLPVTGTISLGEEGSPKVEGAELAVSVEHETYQSQFGETELSSSQSSSIDPHTPSVNGDLGITTSSEDNLMVKHTYPDVGDSPAVSRDGESIDFVSLGVHTDPRTHWSRLMTRLNHSQENSPQTTPHASTPTPPDPRSPPRPEFPPSDTPEGLAVVGVLKDEVHRRQATSSSCSMFSSPPKSERPGSRGQVVVQNQPTQPPSASPTSEQLIKRTRQLQLLESVIAENSSKLRLGPPLSAHTLGAFPRPSSVLIPDQVITPPRSASTNPEVACSSFAPYHHHTQHTHSLSSFSGLLSGPLYGNPIIHPSSQSSSLGTKLPSQLEPPPRQPYSGLTPLSSPRGERDPSVDSAHKGRMLSILTGGRPAAQGCVAATATPHNSHLLSILNNSSPAPATARGAAHARQLQGG